MPYPEYLVAPMRQELVAVGAKECRTPADVDTVLKSPGVTMMVVNSVCGCAAGKARPGIAMALQHANRAGYASRRCSRAPTLTPPTARVEYFTGFPAFVAVDRADARRQAIYMVERRDIEMRSAQGISDLLTMAFDKFCAPQARARAAR